MTDISPYGVTQHADAAMVTADALVGERLSPLPGNALAGSPATFSTAPYVPPKPPRDPSRIGRCPGKNDTCRVGVVKGSDRCIFHTPHVPKDQE